MNRKKIYFVISLYVALFIGLLAFALPVSNPLALLVDLGLVLLLGLFTAVMVFAGAMIGKWRVKGDEDSEFCAKCGYQKAPQGEVGRRCPECGAYWLAEGASKTGRTIRKPDLIFGGVIVLALWIGGSILFAPGLAHLGKLKRKITPTDTLIQEVVNTDMAIAKMEALSSRDLSPEQVRNLVEGLLEARLANSYTYNLDAPFILHLLKSELIPSDLVDRYYEESIRLRMIAPAQTFVGSPVRVAIEMESLGSPSQQYAVSICHSGISVGDTADIGERSDNWVQDDAVGEATSTYVRAGVAGNVTVHCTIWAVAHNPASQLGAVVWGEDGKPQITDQAIWSKEIELEKEIAVAVR